MKHSGLLDASRCVLVVIDMQDSLLKAIQCSEEIVANTIRLVEAAKILRVPALVTVQNAARLGFTTEAIASALPENTAEFNKTAFSCMQCHEFADALEEHKPEQVIICGVEAHVCVSQTALDLLDSGYFVHIAADAVSSRTSDNKSIALDRIRSSGATITSTESAIFELVRDAARPEFKRILPLVK